MKTPQVPAIPGVTPLGLPIAPKGKLKASSIYIGDNGRMFCGTLSCAGFSSFFDGRDISGQRVSRMTPHDAHMARTLDGFDPKCESCGKTVTR